MSAPRDKLTLIPSKANRRKATSLKKKKKKKKKKKMRSPIEGPKESGTLI